MFGFGKKRVLNKDLMYRNVADSIIDILVSSRNLNFDKFISTSPFTLAIATGGEDIPDHFFREKLVLECAFASVLISKTLEGEDVVDQVVAAVKVAIKEKNLPSNNFQLGSLSKDVREIVEKRTRYAGKEAGKQIESHFARKVFGVLMSNDDVDGNYLLYKSLTGLEQTVIFATGSAVRKART